ncbi:SCO2400 family protein [Streptomyces tendae]
MDYCSSCRRHLNGALVCPGCGAYAPDIDPHVGGSTGDGGGSGDAAGAGPRAAWPSPGVDPALAPVSAPGFRADIGAADGPRQTGRAARRRQLARWKKNKRRAVVASAVAIVGGGLTIASVDRHSDHRAQATAAPANQTRSVSPEQNPGQGPPTTVAPTAPERAQGQTPVSGPSQPQPRPSTDSAERGSPSSPRTVRRRQPRRRATAPLLPGPPKVRRPHGPSRTAPPLPPATRRPRARTHDAAAARLHRAGRQHRRGHAPDTTRGGPVVGAAVPAGGMPRLTQASMP